MPELVIKGGTVLVDESDLERLAPYRWRVFSDGRGRLYVRAYVGKRALLMHRFILGTPQGMQTDHINGNGLDNRRENLRAATHAQNGINRKSWSAKSGFKGVYRNGRGWVAQITGNRTRIGVYETPEEAARAYDREAVARYGEFAALNFPAAAAAPTDEPGPTP